MACGTGCLGPGLEPPGDGDNGGMAVGGTTAPTGGTGGAGGTGTAGGAGAGGFGNPQAGSGGEPVGSGGATAGMGAGGTGMSATGGAGGFGGNAGSGGEPSSDDGGTTDPEAPTRDCEDSREVLQLTEVIGAFPLTCMMEAPAGTLMDGTFSIAVTTVREGASAETAWSERKASSNECGEDQAFYVDNALGIPRLVLCPALCDALTMLSDEAAQDAGMSVTVEIIYGCEPPQ